MNLGDSFGISIFADESSGFASKISASHFFMGFPVGITWVDNVLMVVYNGEFLMENCWLLLYLCLIMVSGK